VTRSDSTEGVLAALGHGELIGEMSLADSLRRSANVITLEETDFLLMDRGTFRASVEELPTMALNFANVLSRRLRLANVHLRSVAAMNVRGGSPPSCRPSPRSTVCPPPGMTPSYPYP
jgi:CRP-like cAMP-binding protein